MNKLQRLRAVMRLSRMHEDEIQDMASDGKLNALLPAKPAANMPPTLKGFDEIVPASPQPLSRWQYIRALARDILAL